MASIWWYVAPLPSCIVICHLWFVIWHIKDCRFVLNTRWGVCFYGVPDYWGGDSETNEEGTSQSQEAACGWKQVKKTYLHMYTHTQTNLTHCIIFKRSRERWFCILRLFSNQSLYSALATKVNSTGNLPCINCIYFSLDFNSAGGTGVLVNIDHIAEIVRSRAPQVEVRGLVDAGWFLDKDPAQGHVCLSAHSCPALVSIQRGIKWVK